MKPTATDNVSENAPLLKSRFAPKTRLKARKGHRGRKITSQPPTRRYPMRKA